MDTHNLYNFMWNCIEKIIFYTHSYRLVHYTILRKLAKAITNIKNLN